MYQIRLANAYDIPWLDRAALAAALEHPLEGQRAGLTPLEMAPRYQQRIRTTLSSPQGAGVVALTGSEPAGYALVITGVDGSTDEVNGFVQDWWVSPRHRGRGVGRALLEHCEAWLAARGVRKMKLVLPVDRQAGLRAASRSGFSPEGLLGVKNL